MRQVSLGPFHQRTAFLQVGDMLMYREHVTQRTFVTGATPAGYFMFGGPASPEIVPEWCGRHLRAECLAFGRATFEVDFVIPDESHHIVLLVPTNLLLSCLDEVTQARILSQYHHHLDNSGAFGTSLLGTIDRMISKYLANPELLSDASECRAIESRLMEILGQGLCRYREPSVCPYPSSRRRGFRLAVDYCRTLSAPAPVEELAATAGISQRTLERVFCETLGITPLQYMKRHRMHLVHRELRADNSESATVTIIAQRWGFTELGRFSIEYRQLFGEHPSTTLNTPWRAPPKRFADALPR